MSGLSPNDIGKHLGGDEVDELRNAVEALREHGGVSHSKLADGDPSTAATIRRFENGDVERPDAGTLGKIAMAVLKYRQRIPDHKVFHWLWHVANVGKRPSERVLERLMPAKATKIDDYAGDWRVIHRTRSGNDIWVTWKLTIETAPFDGARPAGWFVMETDYRDFGDPNKMRHRRVEGSVQGSREHLQFVGASDGSMLSMLLDRPPSREFSYLKGLMLGVGFGLRGSYGGRVLARLLRDDDDAAGTFSAVEGKARMTDFENVRRLIGDQSTLRWYEG